MTFADSADTEAGEERLLTEWAARSRLAGHGIPVTPCEVARTVDEAVAAAEKLGFPVVVKLHAAAVAHKTEVGGVHLDLRDPDQIRRSYRAIVDGARNRGARVDGVLVQPYYSEGLDVLVGAARDVSFGPYLLLGLGGIWVEVLDDVVVVALPATRDDVVAALDRLRGASLLRGARGRAGADVGALAEVALALGRVASAAPEVHEVDLNPVRVLAPGQGAVALDARMVLRPVGERPAPRRGPDRAALAALLDPRGVVVVGASKDAGKFGSRLVRSLRRHGFERPLWALHPRDPEVQGIPAYPSMDVSPEPADLAFIALEGAQVSRIVEDVGARGVRAAVVFASGFGEAGADGEARQADLVARASEANVWVVGPNTAGMLSEPAKLYGSFVGTMEMQPVPGGDVVLLTQSGSVGSFLLGRGWERGIGFRAWVATGDEAGVQLADLLDYYSDDPGTRVIALFVEMVRDGARFRAAAQRARSAGKRVVAYAVGRSESGRAAVRSHTGSLGGNQRVYDAVFRQDGVARVRDLDELLDAIQVLSWCRPPGGPRVAVVSSSGASCVIAADDCEANGLALPPPPPACRQELAAILPAFSSASNPLDLTAEVVTRPELAASALRAITDSGAYDALMITLGTQQGPAAMEVAAAIVALRERTELPIVMSRLGADTLGPELLAFYRARRLPVFSTPTRAARALRHLVEQGRRDAPSVIDARVGRGAGRRP